MAATPRLRFGQLLGDFGLDIEMPQIDVRHFELGRERFRDLLFQHVPFFDEEPPETPYAAELARRVLLLGERRFERFARKQFSLYQYLAQLRAFRPCHRSFPVFRAAPGVAPVGVAR